MVLRMWVQWNHLNLHHASLRGRRLLSPSLPFICLLSSHSMLHTVWGLLFKSMHPLTISHMYITPNHTPPPPHLFHLLHQTPSWEQASMLLCLCFTLSSFCASLKSTWVLHGHGSGEHDGHITEDNDCLYSNQQLKEGLGSLSSDGWGPFS